MKKAAFSRYSRARIALLIILLIIISSGLTLIFYAYRAPDDKVISYLEMYAAVTVSENRVGLNADSDALRFGIVPVGGGGMRNFDITIKGSEAAAKVIIRSSGNISEFLTFDRNNFIMHGNATVSAQVNIPNNATLGDYEGVVQILLVKADN